MDDSQSLYETGLRFLRGLVGDAVEFRDGQWEAIDALVRRRARLLVVQRTGWGKSVVYFLATRLLRDRGAGPTLLISPLLALMRNQIAAARRLGIRAATINSTNPSDWHDIVSAVRANQVDILLVSPERLASESFHIEVLVPVATTSGLLVVDEAHCISDWGHDFRPDYRRIVRILKRLPPSVPVCATTATANDRVVADVTAQLGPALEVVHGPLVRESLRLQTVPLADDATKLAWLACYVPRLAGSGIIYALTVRWTERIAQWLQVRGINAVPYSADLPHEARQEREDQLLNNQVNALVATTALGMGFDKPDLGFVVHFHQPASVIHYYQQVGRAGRAISQAYGLMLSGGDDRDINDYFLAQAFPPERDVSRVLDALGASVGGRSIRELQAAVNLSFGQIDRVLKTLAVDDRPPVAVLEGKWVRTPNPYDAPRRQALIARLNQVRRTEQAQMDAYCAHRGCLMEFLAKALDDAAAGPCGRCAPCQAKPDVLRHVPHELTQEAVAFLRRSDIALEPRAQWQAGAFPVYGWSGRIAADVRAEPGRALCILGDAGWGQMVRRGKYEDGRFADVLVDALAGLVRGWRPQPAPTWVTCVSSPRHPQLVPDLAKRAALRLGLPFRLVVERVGAPASQKEMQNSWWQARNLDGAFRVAPGAAALGPVLLVDDIVDSRWTFTIVAALLRAAGSGPVFPIALAANR